MLYNRMPRSLSMQSAAISSFCHIALLACRHANDPHPRLWVSKKKYHRAIWLSDIHLGTRGCKAGFLLDFLRSNDSDVLYLVGDIIDGWALKRSWYWDQHHNDVIQKLLRKVRKVRKGTRVYYIPGNHDEFARDSVDTLFGGVTVKSHAIHEMRDGRRLLVMHGDEFDGG